MNIQTDSRKIKKGDTFVAIKTIQGDGHLYIESAIKNGATTIVADHGKYSVKTIIVDDTRKYLEDYLEKTYSKYLEEMTIIGITGTNGKSSFVHLIYEALNNLNVPCSSIGTVGYFTKDGKKCSLANTSPDICDLYGLLMDSYETGHKVVALEASSQGLAENRLAGIKYDYVIFSNLTRDHLDYHKTFESYALAKQKLFKNIKPNGKSIVNIDDEYKEYFLINDNTITFGENKCDYQLMNYKMNIEGTTFIYKHKDEYQVKTKLIGKYNIFNLLPVIIILEDMNFKQDEIIKVISKINLPSGRIERIKFNTNNIYIDYAHTPDGLKQVVSSIKEVTKGDTYVVFCCRGNRDIGRRKGMMEAATDLAKFAIVTNDHVFTEDPMNVVKDMIKDIKKNNYKIIPDRKKAIYYGIDLLKENDSLLILGHGHEEYLINEKHEKIPFIEKDIVEDYLLQKCN